MNFSEFQNRSRLYVIGALEPEELIRKKGRRIHHQMLCIA